MMGYSVLVCGGRNYNKVERVNEVLDAIGSHNISILIHGGASGADNLAGQWALKNGVSQAICPANWDRHGRSAGPKRNAAMASLRPQIFIAFPGGPGTSDMIKRMYAMKDHVIELYSVIPDDDYNYWSALKMIERRAEELQ